LKGAVESGRIMQKAKYEICPRCHGTGQGYGMMDCLKCNGAGRIPSAITPEPASVSRSIADA
jgi:DnaJ-class molecular chaperone